MNLLSKDGARLWRHALSKPCHAIGRVGRSTFIHLFIHTYISSIRVSLPLPAKIVLVSVREEE